ncbi:bursicon isoform X1 [Solenopsis invicta]|uniref:bursicon isoform X1 n=1 Tax=Solenopsis invicta TaxID=13686 RepID=UPI00193E74C2|nr:bursicon isoform X1 [Solenopsis invicta]
MYRSRGKLFCYFVINGLVICLMYGGTEAIVGVDECQATRVIHFLQYPGCVPKPIPSYACRGRCSSYLQVSGSKMWQMERSCMCCQESGEREASVSLFCPRAKPGEKKFRKVRKLDDSGVSGVAGLRSRSARGPPLGYRQRGTIVGTVPRRATLRKRARSRGLALSLSHRSSVEITSTRSPSLSSLS